MALPERLREINRIPLTALGVGDVISVLGSTEEPYLMQVLATSNEDGVRVRLFGSRFHYWARQSGGSLGSREGAIPSYGILKGSSNPSDSQKTIHPELRVGWRVLIEDIEDNRGQWADYARTSAARKIEIRSPEDSSPKS